MCGIIGILSLNSEPVDPLAIKFMADIIAHRGPDDAGYVAISLGLKRGRKENYWVEFCDRNFWHKNEHLPPLEGEFVRESLSQNPWHLVMGHRRLAIIDLTSKGHQPMADRTKGVWIVYKGEVYNFRELRKELEAKGHEFSSHTDTEVVLRSYKEWGIEVIERFNGMFAFSLWDSLANRLYLVRDRYGVKPLYYSVKDGKLIFASEVKAILASKMLDARVDPYALNEYFTFQNILTERTLFEGVSLLLPGHLMEVDLSNKEAAIKIRKYWDYGFSSENQDQDKGNLADLVSHLFKEAVLRQLVSDVPVGSFLSGGMDTGSIAAVAGKYFGRIHTFSVGFDLSSASGLELGFDERTYAEFMANYLKTEHYEVILHAGDMEAVMPDLVWHLEDLRVGQSYPNFYGCKLASRFVKVCLSGAGGDELFGGYPWRYFRAFDPTGREDYFSKYYSYWQRLVSDEEKVKLFAPEIFSNVKDYSTYEVFKGVFNGTNSEPQNTEDFVNMSLHFEAKTFLHGLFIVDDKLSMAHSLEVRVPFMDNELVNLALRIRPRHKLKDIKKLEMIDEDEIGKLIKYGFQTSDGKIILREAMERIIPRSITERAKQGFSAPDASWFRGESIDYIKGFLLDSKARIHNYLQYDFVKGKIEDHIAGTVNNRLLIWSFLCFEWWLKRFLDKTEIGS